MHGKCWTVVWNASCQLVSHRSTCSVHINVKNKSSGEKAFGIQISCCEKHLDVFHLKNYLICVKEQRQNLLSPSLNMKPTLERY